MYESFKRKKKTDMRELRDWRNVNYADSAKRSAEETKRKKTSVCDVLDWKFWSNKQYTLSDTRAIVMIDSEFMPNALSQNADYFGNDDITRTMFRFSYLIFLHQPPTHLLSVDFDISHIILEDCWHVNFRELILAKDDQQASFATCTVANDD